MISWTKEWSSSDDGTIFGGGDLDNIQTDIEGHSHSGIATLLSELNDVALTSVVQGNILYRGSTYWNNLGVGTAGNTLKSGGASANPSWAALNLAGGAAYISGILPTANGGTGSTSEKIVQVVNTQTGAYATGATTINLDDTPMEKTEGNEFMTLAITPTSATNKLKIDVVFMGDDNNYYILVGLFQDTITNALACGAVHLETTTIPGIVKFTHYMTAGTTSATTFKVRAGSSTGDIMFNGGHDSAARLFGGTLASSITITEIV